MFYSYASLLYIRYILIDLFDFIHWKGLSYPFFLYSISGLCEVKNKLLLTWSLLWLFVQRWCLFLQRGSEFTILRRGCSCSCRREAWAFSPSSCASLCCFDWFWSPPPSLFSPSCTASWWPVRPGPVKHRRGGQRVSLKCYKWYIFFYFLSFRESSCEHADEMRPKSDNWFLSQLLCVQKGRKIMKYMNVSNT